MGRKGTEPHTASACTALGVLLAGDMGLGQPGQMRAPGRYWEAAENAVAQRSERRELLGVAL